MSGITEDKHRGYIGFGIFLVALGGVLDGRGDMVSAVAIMVGGAVLMWLFREEDKEGEKENGAADHSGSSLVDKLH